jgi:sulfur carrier protein
MNVTLNGVATDIADGTTLAEIVADRLRTDRGVAAAVDGEVAPKATWPGFVLRDGQAIELLTAVQGG